MCKYKIYCINLIEREDRYNLMKTQFDKYNIEVNFLRVNKHKNGGRYGCFDSHIQCIKDAYNNNLEYCVMMEDDNYIDPNFKEYLEYSLDFFNNNSKYVDILYSQNRGLLCVYDKVNENIYKCISYGGSCYILNSRSIKLVIDTYQDYINIPLHVDIYYMKIMYNRSYCCNKFLTTSQYFTHSDNDYNYLLNKVISYIWLCEPFFNKIAFNVVYPLTHFDLFKIIYIEYILYYIILWVNAVSFL